MAKEQKAKQIIDFPIECHCSMCGATTIIKVRATDYNKRVKERIPVQVCFSYLSVSEREAVISGTCLNCQKAIFPGNYDKDGNWIGMQ